MNSHWLLSLLLFFLIGRQRRYQPESAAEAREGLPGNIRLPPATGIDSLTLPVPEIAAVKSVLGI